VTHAQRKLLHATLADLTIRSRDDRLRALSHITSRDVESSNDLTAAEYEQVICHLQAVQSWPEADRLAEVDILTRPADDPWAVAS
jgi:hypothetical protein